MLLQFSASNYRSILEPVTFSMMADPDQSRKGRHEAELIHTCAGDVLSCSLIYGANGSGKSTLFRAMNLLKQLVENGYKNDQMSSFWYPHKLAARELPSQFEVFFLIESILYIYSIEFNDREILREELYFSPNKRRARIFSRNRNKVELGSRFRKSLFASGISAMTAARPLLSCCAEFDHYNEKIQSVYDWFKNDLVIVLEESDSDLDRHIRQIYYEDTAKREQMVRILNDFDIPVQKIVLEKQQQKHSLEQFPDIFTGEFRKSAELQNKTGFDVTFGYGEFEINLSDESDGIKKLFFILGVFLNGFGAGKTLIYDGLETGLHRSVFGRLVQVIQKNGGSASSQTVIATHDTALLSLELFRKDQIWFTQLRRSSRSTDLYSLLEIKDVRQSENIQRGYIHGKYGAVPILNQEL